MDLCIGVWLCILVDDVAWVLLTAWLFPDTVVIAVCCSCLLVCGCCFLFSWVCVFWLGFTMVKL